MRLETEAFLYELCSNLRNGGDRPEESPSEIIPRNKVFTSNQIFYDKVGNYWSEDFWGNYNIIAPTESLEHAVDKLKKQSN